MADPSIASLVVPAAAVLVGVAVGKFWDTSGEVRRWRREQKSAAYAEFLGTAEVAALEFAQTTEDFDRDRVHEATSELTRCSSGVDIFGSNEAAEAGRALWNYLALELDVREVENMDDEAWAAVSTEVRGRLRAFRDAARQDLKSAPLPE